MASVCTWWTMFLFCSSPAFLSSRVLILTLLYSTGTLVSGFYYYLKVLLHAALRKMAFLLCFARLLCSIKRLLSKPPNHERKRIPPDRARSLIFLSCRLMMDACLIQWKTLPRLTTIYTFPSLAGRVIHHAPQKVAVLSWGRGPAFLFFQEIYIRNPLCRTTCLPFEF